MRGRRERRGRRGRRGGGGGEGGGGGGEGGEGGGGIEGGGGMSYRKKGEKEGRVVLNEQDRTSRLPTWSPTMWYQKLMLHLSSFSTIQLVCRIAISP